MYNAKRTADTVGGMKQVLLIPGVLDGTIHILVTMNLLTPKVKLLYGAQQISTEFLNIYFLILTSLYVIK